MPVYTGTGGKVEVEGGEALSISSWTLEVKSEPIEANEFQQSWKEFVPAARGWSGSFSGMWDIDPAGTNAGQKAASAAALGGTVATLKLTVNSTATAASYEGEAFITGMSPKVSADGLVEVSFDFIGDGALTLNGMPSS